jgi:competence protein ComEA
MSFDTPSFFSRQTSPAACMTGWQAMLPASGMPQWWSAQLDWPTSLSAMTDWMLQFWTAPLTLVSSSLQAWNPAVSVELVPATAAVPTPTEFVERVAAPQPAPVVVVEVPQEVAVEAEVVVEIAVAPAPVADGRVSVNHGSEDELVALKGIGPALARLIIAQRPYASVEALVDLKGIGPKLLEQLHDQLKL